MSTGDSFQSLLIKTSSDYYQQLFDYSWSYSDMRSYIIKTHSIDESTIEYIELAHIRRFKDSDVSFLKSLWVQINCFPSWLRTLILAFISSLVALFFVSCGSTTKATIRQAHEGSTTTVTISTNNPTNWQVKPDVSLNQK